MSSLPLLSTVCGAVALAACVAIHGCWCLCRSLRLVVSVLVSWAVGVCVGIYDCWCQQSCIAIARAVSICSCFSVGSQSVAFARALSRPPALALFVATERRAQHKAQGAVGQRYQPCHLCYAATAPVCRCSSRMHTLRHVHQVTFTREQNARTKRSKRGMPACFDKERERPHGRTRRGMATCSNRRWQCFLSNAMPMLSPRHAHAD